jgi:hypothetical protein
VRLGEEHQRYIEVEKVRTVRATAERDRPQLECLWVFCGGDPVPV